MKYIALLLGLILSAWLLKREVRRRPSLSSTLWIPTLFLMVIASRPLSSWIGGGGHAWGRNSSSLLDQLFYVFVFSASIVIASKRGVRWGCFFAANLPLMLIYAYFLCSVTWSDDPTGSALRIIKDFGMLLVIGLIYSEKEPIQAIRAVFIRSACVLFPLSLVFDRWFPNFGREFSIAGGMMYSGVTGQKNSLGELIWVFCTFILWDYLDSPASNRRKGLLRRMSSNHLILILMGIALLYQCQSKTALVALVIAGALTVRKGPLASRGVSAAAYVTALSTPFLLWFTKEFGDVIAPILRAMGRDLTFTGRTNIWESITAETVNPIIGCGFWNFWQGPRGFEISREVHWQVPTAHCGYLDIYLDGGVIGLVLLFFALAACGWRLINGTQRGKLRIVGLAVLSAAIVYNLTESSLFRIGALWFATMLMMVVFPQKKRSANVERERSNEVRVDDMQPVSEGAEWLTVR